MTAAIHIQVAIALSLAVSLNAIITIGYGSQYTINIPVGTKDCLPYFDQASEAHLKSKGTLHIGPGTFVIGNQWRILASNVKIRGSGIGKTVLKLKNFATPFKSAGFVVSTRTQNVTMSDMSIHGNKINQDNKNPKTLYGRFCIFIAGYKNWTFRRIECMHFQEYGFDPHGIKEQINGKFIRKTSTTSYNLTIEDCLSHDNGWDGITIDQTVGVIIRNNTAYNNGRHGINIVTASNDVWVEGNRVFNNGHDSPFGFGCGLLADTNKEDFTTKNVTFKNNLVTGQGTTGGACAKGAENVVFVGNVIKDSVTCATFINNAKNVKFIKNRCIGNKQDFLYKDGGLAPTLSGNVFVRRAGPAPVPNAKPVPGPVPGPLPKTPGAPAIVSKTVTVNKPHVG